MLHGKLIAVEGVNGAGKTTLLTRLSAALASEGIPHQLANESTLMPDAYLTHAQMLRSLWDGRRRLYAESIVPMLQNGTHILCNRSWISTCVYQGNPRLQMAVAGYCGIPSPDALLLIDVPAVVAAQRLAAAKRMTYSMAWLATRRRQYLEIAQAVSWRMPTFVLDGRYDPTPQALMIVRDVIAGVARQPTGIIWVAAHISGGPRDEP